MEVLAPDPCRAAVASFKDDHRTARASALQVQPATTPNINEARKVILRYGSRWQGGARAAEDEGQQEDGDGKGKGRMIDSRGRPAGSDARHPDGED